jgi:hypothetical protein
MYFFFANFGETMESRRREIQTRTRGKTVKEAMDMFSAEGRPVANVPRGSRYKKDPASIDLVIVLYGNQTDPVTTFDII